MTECSIGQAARRTGVKVPTIRYYEEIGLLPAPPRTGGNRRVYGEQALRRLAFVRHARDMGFGIEDIRDLLALSTEPQASCQEVDRLARAHLERIETRLERLERLRGELERMIEECGQGRVGDCLILETLGR